MVNKNVVYAIIIAPYIDKEIIEVIINSFFLIIKNISNINEPIPNKSGIKQYKITFLAFTLKLPGPSVGFG